MHPAVRPLLIIVFVVLVVILFPALLVIALLLLLLWLIMNLATHGPVWIFWQRDAALLRMGKLPWFRRLPGITPTLRRVEQREAEREAERERQAEEKRRRKAEAEERERSERDRALLNPLEKGDRRYKLLLTQGDRATLLGIMQQKPMPDDGSMRVMQNFAFFENRIAGMNGDLKALCNGLAKLMVVDISLTRDQDNPQLIFESMNSTGCELSQADGVGAGSSKPDL